MGCPASPFIGEEKAWVTAEEEERNETEREKDFQGRRVLLLLHTGPANPVDVNRDGFMSWPCSSLAPCAGIICRSWHSTPSRRTSWRTDALVSVRTRIRQNSTSTSDTVLDVNHQVWPIMATGYIKACQPSSLASEF